MRFKNYYFFIILVLAYLFFNNLFTYAKGDVNYGKILLNDAYDKVYIYSTKKDYNSFLKNIGEKQEKIKKELENKIKKIKDSQLGNNYLLNQQLKELVSKYNKVFKQSDDTLLNKIKKNSIKIKIDKKKININKKTFQIESKISEADYVVYLGIDFDNFITKKSISNGGTFLISLNKNYSFLNKDNIKNQNIQNEILQDINKLIISDTYEDFINLLKNYKKEGKEYQQLFSIYSLNNFLQSFNLYISYRGGQFGKINPGIDFRYYNNIFYRKGKNISILEKKLPNKLWLIIPLKYNKEIGEVLGVNNSKIVFKNPADNTLFLEVKYNQEGNLYFDKIIKLYNKSKENKNTIDIAKMYLLNKSYLSIKEEPWYKIFFIIISSFIGFVLGYYFIRYTINKLNNIIKFEKEQL